MKWFLVLFLLLGVDLLAVEPANKITGIKQQECSASAAPVSKPGKLYWVDHHRDVDDMAKIKVAAEEFTDIAFKLNFNIPKHVATFASSQELALLLANGAHPAPHAIDGSLVFKAARESSSVYEFVTSGCPLCHSYFQDTTPWIQQLSIFAHVLGHNHVSQTSNYGKIRKPEDAARSAFEMVELMNQLKYNQNISWEEISLFYQKIYSMKIDQDLVVGSYDSVDSLIKTLDKKRTEDQKFSGSSSMLQSMTALGKTKLKPWQHEMLRIFEQREAWQGFATMTKTMNEGFATFSMFIIPKHSKYNEMRHWIDYSSLLAKVLGTKEKVNPASAVNNPYWLGLEAWMNLYNKFKKNHKEKYETEFDLDAAFVSYASKIIETHSDASFLRLALDQQWLIDKKLIMTRELKEGDPRYDASIKQDPDDKLILVVSNDPKRLINKIARQVGNRGDKMPRIRFIEESHAGRYILLRQDLVQNHGIPLEIFSATKKIYDLASTYKTSVAVDTAIPSYYIAEKLDAETKAEIKDLQKNAKWFPKDGEVHKLNEPMLIPVRIIVSPDRKVEVKYWSTNDSLDKELEGFRETLMSSVETYYEDSILGLSEKYQGVIDSDLRQKFGAATQGAVSNTAAILPTAPSASLAVAEYLRFVEERTVLALKRAMNGQGTGVATNRGMQVRVFPEIAFFGLDQRYAQIRREAYKKAIVDGEGVADPYADAFTDLVSFDAWPGKILRIPAKKQGEGKGEGEGEGQGEGKGKGKGEGEPKEGEESEEGEGEGPGGAGGSNPEFVEVPWKDWIELINDKLKLRNIRKTLGRSRQVATRRGGSVTLNRDPLREDRVVEKAMGYGLAGLEFEWQQRFESEERFSKMTEEEKSIFLENEIDKLSYQEIVETGLRYMPEGEYVAKSSVEVMQPEFDAVILIAVDFSISMKGDPLQRAKTVAINLQEKIKSEYNNVIIRYVVFDTKAKEVTEKQAWSVTGGGGTAYEEGVGKSIEILEEYPMSKFNRYAYVFGDSGQHYTPEVAKAFEKIIDMTDASGYIKTGTMGVDAFDQGIENLFQNKKKKFSKSEWTERGGTLVDSIIDLFKEPEE